MPQIVWTVLARDDLRAIDEYLTQEASPDYAVRLLTTIRNRARFLENFPRGARPLKDGTRVLRVLDTPYLIRFRTRNDMVEILRVHHEREDWFVQL